MTYSSEQKYVQNPWLLKEILVSKVVNEKWRLNALLNRFVHPAIDRSVLEFLKQACIDFIQEYNLTDKMIKTNADALYLVRNTVVHRQFELPNGHDILLGTVNSYLFLLCYELISKFNLHHGSIQLLVDDVQEE